MGIKEAPYGWSRLAIWAINYRTAWCYAIWTGHAGPTEKWLLNLLKYGMVLQGSCITEETAGHSAGHRRKWLTNCQYRWNCLLNFLLHGKVCQMLWACRLKMDAPMLQKNFEWLSRQQGVSVNSRVLEVAYNGLPVDLGNIISFWGLWWSWEIDSYSFP